MMQMEWNNSLTPEFNTLKPTALQILEYIHFLFVHSYLCSAWLCVTKITEQCCMLIYFWSI